jgi:transcription-repair coupling factor (superfamily II helicase)
MSNLTYLLDRYHNHPAVRSVLAQLEQPLPLTGIRLNGLIGAQESFVLAAISVKLQAGTATHLLIATSKEEAAYRFNDLQGLLGEQKVCFFPDSFKSPAVFDHLNATQMLQRSEVVHKMTTADAPQVVITYPEALFEKVVRPEVLMKNRIEVTLKEKLDVDWMIEILIEYNFERVDFVFEPGQFSVRGGIVDLFSYGNDLPYRVELFDDEVESIRIFDPLTQLSQRDIERLSIVPNLNTRFQQDQKVSLLQIIPQKAVLWVKDMDFLIDRLQHCFEKAEQFAAKLTALDTAELREIFRDRAFLYPGEVKDDIAERTLVYLKN